MGQSPTARAADVLCETESPASVPPSIATSPPRRIAAAATGRGHRATSAAERLRCARGASRSATPTPRFQWPASLLARRALDTAAPGRALLLIGAAPDDATALATVAGDLGFVVRADDPRRSIVACPQAGLCLIAARALAAEVTALAATKLYDPHLRLCQGLRAPGGCRVDCGRNRARLRHFHGSARGAASSRRSGRRRRRDRAHSHTRQRGRSWLSGTPICATEPPSTSARS